MKKRHQQKLIVLTFVLLLALNLPILLLFDSIQEIFGLPAIYIYIFSIWSISIFTSLLIVSRYYE
ncbi:hypothetical protein [Flavobacterium tibetense]|jgi:hypothetical protein|uniref:Uncharacterized protein n=1 Tax=Flavobacterium tibetense TaxID=2233533 RepID=A0A365P1Y3_9FLAO|nr:hypothetical protein [Flavobacterium tibetense]RBA28549.1 hypothetical protein DPN68_05910 [Flavobacterium tibetense]